MGSPEVTAREGAALAGLALRVVAARLTDRAFEPQPPDEPALRAPGASFVTLERAGRLRGCIGALDAVRPLYLDVARNAVRAMVDPRLPALGPEEWPDLDLTVSVLTKPEPLPVACLDDLIDALRPGVDGLILSQVLSQGPRRATFLPSVWHKLPKPADFVAALVAKGGWSPADAPRLAAQRYAATEFRDAAPRARLDA